jgi:phospholipid-binding lipoprotein MlaA
MGSRRNTNRRSFNSAVRFGALLLAAALVAGCASAPPPGDAEAMAEFNQINDPGEPANRAVFKVNKALDSALLRPAAIAYKDYTPGIFQTTINNVLNNLRAPVIFFNDILQGEIQRAGTTFFRFIVNSTIGFLGLADPATEMGLVRHNEDFGQTLAVWGVPEGPYLMLPIFGPSNPRDAVGLVVDFLIDPLNIWAANTNREWVPLSRAGVRAVDTRARNFDALEDLENTSLDFYAAIRSLYRQRRNDEISNGAGSANMPSPGLGGTLPDGPPDEAVNPGESVVIGEEISETQ